MMLMIKLSLVLMLAVSLGLVLRRRQAALGHQLLVVLLALGALICLLPALPDGLTWKWVIQADPDASSALWSAAETDAPNVAAMPSDGGIIASPPTPLAAADAREPFAVAMPWTRLWLSGLLVLLGGWGWMLARSAGVARRAVRMSDRQLSRRGLADLGQFSLRVSDDAAGAFLWPARHAVIIIPRSLLQTPTNELRLLLAHELAHHARGDGWRFLTLRVLTLLLWFHPLAWWTEKLARECAELACDACVAGPEPEARENYASVLLAFARRGSRTARRAGFAHLGGGLRGRVRDLLGPAARPWGAVERTLIWAPALLVVLSVWMVAATRQELTSLGALTLSIKNTLTPHRYDALKPGHLQVATFYDGAEHSDTRVAIELIDAKQAQVSWLELGPLPKFVHGMVRSEVELRPGVTATGRVRVSGVHPDGMVDGVAVAIAQIDANGFLEIRRSRYSGAAALPRTICAWPLAFNPERIEVLANSTPKWEMDTMYRLLCGADIVDDGLHQI